MEYYSIGSPEDIVVSSSGLKAFEKSPRSFLRFLEVDSIPTPAMQFGTLLHKWFENPDQFVVADFDKPTPQMCEWVEAVYNLKITDEDKLFKAIFIECNYKSLKDENKIITKFLTEGKEYFDYLINSEGKIALTAAERTTFNGIVDTVKEKVLLWESLFLTQNVEKEKEIFWTEQAKYGEVKCKAKIDRIDNDVFIRDFKSVSDNPYDFESFGKWKWLRQLAFYARGVMSLGHEVQTVSIIACSKTAPFDVVEHVFSMDELEEEMIEIVNLLDEISWHQINGWTYKQNEQNGIIDHRKLRQNLY